VHALSRKPSFLWIAVIVAIVRAGDTARLVRLLVLRALPDDSIEAARALGASPTRIALSHLLPQIWLELLVSTVFSFGAVVLTETSLSFLGLGVRSEVASWGEMLSEVGLGAGPLLAIPAAAALGVTLGSLCLVADAIREVRAGSR
jgi:ABC-type dipeptide/oligopeptide/nickel transport system permease subunit